MITVDQNRVSELMQTLRLSYHEAYMRVKQSTPVAAANSAESEDILALVHSVMQERGIGFAEALREAKKKFPQYAANSRSSFSSAGAVEKAIARQNGGSSLMRAVQKSTRRFAVS